MSPAFTLPSHLFVCAIFISSQFSSLGTLNFLFWRVWYLYMVVFFIFFYIWRKSSWSLNFCCWLEFCSCLIIFLRSGWSAEKNNKYFGKHSYLDLTLRIWFLIPTLNSGGHMKNLNNDSVVLAPVSCLSMSCLCMRMTF